MIAHARSVLRRLRCSNRGAVTIFAAIGSIAFIGVAAITVDVAYVFHAKRVLQASADAAALAGAMELYANGANSAVKTASDYSGASGKKNADANLSVTATPQSINCTGYTGATCTPDSSSAANGIVVTESTNVPLYFARIFGTDTIPISATAYALSTGGKSRQLDVAVIIDTTDSMNNGDSSCSIAFASRLDCAFGGLKTLLKGFSPPDQQVALFTFPGLKPTTDVATEYDKSSTTPSSVAKYDASPVYRVVDFSTDYKSGSSLNTSSNLVRAARGGVYPYTSGMSAIGGAGTFYADALTAAHDYINTSGRTGVDKMIILLTDGDANSKSPSTNQGGCQAGVVAASHAQSAHETIVTIAYGASTTRTGKEASCTTDTSNLTACSTLLKMASQGNGSTAAPQWFYSDTVGGSSTCTSSAHSITDLSAIFQDIGNSFTNARLIPSS